MVGVPDLKDHVFSLSGDFAALNDGHWQIERLIPDRCSLISFRLGLLTPGATLDLYERIDCREGIGLVSLF